ncbi:type II toxin-antitoxin system VapC family toxin [Umezawaea sp. Da 62-37]|uniref:type II toxin-antitoxin system VapC family toxin n=1 Tax=Umezawaea sp. Da 62-37 TaxID=3075927 RepID=UPI0028F6EF4D|nr:type II toxin-antitoxin system VapC family toxin [Umezawaea sp. Da 62-37]WNV89849.1 type II toxin-antitoxin system VapC family toxin [Umezawaea sp. Da 62-37]
MIYLDSSALVKLVRKEAESAALGLWLKDNDHPVVSSALARTEVVRAVRRDSETLGARAARVLSGVETMPMTYDLLDEAGLLPGDLRSCDAIHLVSALRLRGDLDAFVAYDKRLMTAAQDAGLHVVAPTA